MDYWTFPQAPITETRIRRVRLIPLERHQAPRLAAELIEPGTWFYEKRGVRTHEDFAALVERNLEAREKGERVPWVMELEDTGEWVGLSMFVAPNREHRYVEIGGTWIARRWQRTFVNTAVKHLMLSHAFERLGCARVAFKVDAENLRSQAAMQRLGAVYEGELRHAWVFAEGRDRRNMRIYSVLEAEWPAMKAKLESWLQAPRGEALNAKRIENELSLH